MALEFEFFTSFTPQYVGDAPVTIGCDKCSDRVVAQLRAYPGKQFIHSSNPWSVPVERRSKEWVLENEEKLVNEKTVGVMSLNIPPSYDRFDHWNLSSEAREWAARTCLQNANWALEHKRVKVPLYCTIYVSTYEDSRRWFKAALDSGHTAFCSGVAEFLKDPRFIGEGIRRIAEVTLGARSVLGDAPFHVSGVASLNLLPILCYLGATSSDGSTPVTSALARGTIYDSSGRAYKAANLSRWSCDCEHCSRHSREEALSKLKGDATARLHHNISIWRRAVRDITGCSDREELAELIVLKINTGTQRHMKALWDNVRDIEGKLAIL